MHNQRPPQTEGSVLTTERAVPELAAIVGDLVVGRRPCSIILVEGVSDQLALEALAARQGRDLGEEGVVIVPLGGATNIGHFLDLLAVRGLDVDLAGVCDIAEEKYLQRGLERAGRGFNLTRADMERLGFYVCVADLEDELIRSLGVASVLRVVESHNDLGSFHTFQKQPAWQGRAVEDQLRRWLVVGAPRKPRYVHWLVDALDPTRVPRPLDRVLARVGRALCHRVEIDDPWMSSRSVF